METCHFEESDPIRHTRKERGQFMLIIIVTSVHVHICSNRVALVGVKLFLLHKHARAGNSLPGSTMLYGADKGLPCADTVRQHCHSLIHKTTGRSLFPSRKPRGYSGALVGTQSPKFSVSGVHSEPAESGRRTPIKGQSSSCRVESAPQVVKEIWTRFG